MAGGVRKRQAAIFTAGFGAWRPRVPVAPDRLERAALARMGRNAGAYVAGGAGLERTVAANRAAFDHVRLKPRVLRDVAGRYSSIELFGRPIVLKGVLQPEDAARAVAAGMDAVVVSNHGGRQVDGAVAALDVLPGVLAAVGGRVRCCSTVACAPGPTS